MAPLERDLVVAGPAFDAGRQPDPYRQVDIDVRRLRTMYRGTQQLYAEQLRSLRVLVGLAGQAGRPVLNDMQIQKLRAGLEFVTSAELRTQRQQIADYLARCSRGTLETAKAHDQIVGALSDDQLERTMRAEFLRSAHTWTDAEWALVDQVRATKAAAGAKAAMLRMRDGMRRLKRGEEPQQGSEDT